MDNRLKWLIIIVLVAVSVSGVFAARIYIESRQNLPTEGSDISVQPDGLAGTQDTDDGNTTAGAVSEQQEGQNKPSLPRLKDVKVKGIYLTGWVAGREDRLNQIIDLINRTELNAVVLDIKDDDGFVGYESNVASVRQINAFKKKFDVDSVLKKLKDNNIYVIGRIVCFKDPFLAVRKPELAVKRPGGQLWRENGVVPWVNPYNEETWKYNIDIAKEAVEKGFDEIQFDYVRFPTPIYKSDIKYNTDVPKTDAINGFLKLANKELSEGLGVKVSADVFGIICESAGDTEDIGQNIETIGMDIDYISPMLYPSHYANARQNGVGQHVNGVLYTAPDLEPYGVVYNSLIKARSRIENVENYKAKVRPYLQDFTASWLHSGYYQVYGAEQVRAQIKAVYDAGYEEWILWNQDNVYSTKALLEEEKE